MTAPLLQVENLEAGAPSVGGGEPRHEIVRAPAPEVGELDHAAGELGARHAEQRAKREGREEHVHAFEALALTDEGGRGMEAAHEGGERARPLRGRRHLHDFDRSIETDDQVHVARRQPRDRRVGAVWQPAGAEARVARDQATQCGMR